MTRFSLLIVLLATATNCADPTDSGTMLLATQPDTVDTIIDEAARGRHLPAEAMTRKMEQVLAASPRDFATATVEEQMLALYSSSSAVPSQAEELFEVLAELFETGEHQGKKCEAPETTASLTTFVGPCRKGEWVFTGKATVSAAFYDEQKSQRDPIEFRLENARLDHGGRFVNLYGGVSSQLAGENDKEVRRTARVALRMSVSLPGKRSAVFETVQVVMIRTERGEEASQHFHLVESFSASGGKWQRVSGNPDLLSLFRGRSKEGLVLLGGNRMRVTPGTEKGRLLIEVGASEAWIRESDLVSLLGIEHQ